MKIIFVRNSRPHESDEQFVAGETYELNEASAQRWINRGAAEVSSERVAASIKADAGEKPRTSAKGKGK